MSRENATSVTLWMSALNLSGLQTSAPPKICVPFSNFFCKTVNPAAGSARVPACRGSSEDLVAMTGTRGRVRSQQDQFLWSDGATEGLRPLAPAKTREVI